MTCLFEKHVNCGERLSMKEKKSSWCTPACSHNNAMSNLLNFTNFNQVANAYHNFEQFTTKKAAIKKYLDFLGFELVTMIFAAKHANHWTREPSCQEVDLKDAIFAEGHLLIKNLRL